MKLIVKTTRCARDAEGAERPPQIAGVPAIEEAGGESRNLQQPDRAGIRKKARTDAP